MRLGIEFCTGHADYVLNVSSVIVCLDTYQPSYEATECTKEGKEGKEGKLKAATLSATIRF